MRRGILYLLVLGFGVCAGCMPTDTDSQGSVLDALQDLTGKPDTDASVTPASNAYVVNDTVTSGAYKLFDLGATTPGDAWTVEADGIVNGYRSFLVVLLDEDHNLLQRDLVRTTNPLQYAARLNTTHAYLGVAPAYGGSGGDFRFQITRKTNQAVPAPAQQVLYINFAGGSDVSIHSRDGLSFPAFDAGLIGDEYDGFTPTMKSAIVDAVREDYASYNLVVYTSDDGPPPSGPYSTVHLGGYDARLLGLADSVDQYNSSQSDAAIVYVETFGDFSVMQLTADEMGQMIGNVVSHEFGHLLGLFHTAVPADVMDTTGSAWDLAENQSFLRGELEESVFPMGYEDSPMRLAEILGYSANLKQASRATSLLSDDAALRRAELRELVQVEMHYGCGTCLELDGE